MLIFHSFVRLPEGVAVAHGDFLFFFIYTNWWCAAIDGVFMASP